MNAGKAFQEIANFLFVAEGRLTSSASHELCKQCRSLRNGELKQLEAEHAALVAVAEAAEAFQKAADAMDTSYGTSDFLPGEKNRVYFWRLSELKTALANLAAVRAGNGGR